MNINFFSLTFYSRDEPFQWERTFFTYKIYDKFFVRNTTLLRTKHSEHHAWSFYLFLPGSVERKDGKEWHPSMAMHRELRKGRWKIPPSWRVKACEDGDELCRDEDASMDFGTFTDFEHAHAFLLLCSVPTALHHSLLCPHACTNLRDSGRYWNSILCLYPSWRLLSDKNDSEGPIWTAGKEGLCAWRERNFLGALQGCAGCPNTRLPPWAVAWLHEPANRARQRWAGWGTMPLRVSST